MADLSKNIRTVIEKYCGVEFKSSIKLYFDKILERAKKVFEKNNGLPTIKSKIEVENDQDSKIIANEENVLEDLNIIREWGFVHRDDDCCGMFLVVDQPVSICGRQKFWYYTPDGNLFMQGECERISEGEDTFSLKIGYKSKTTKKRYEWLQKRDNPFDGNISRLKGVEDMEMLYGAMADNPECIEHLPVDFFNRFRNKESTCLSENIRDTERAVLDLVGKDEDVELIKNGFSKQYEKINNEKVK